MKQKYVVFKKEEWDKYHKFQADLPSEVEDAVVLRKQDKLTGPALHCYAAAAALAAELSEDAQLRNIADYFHEEAMDSDALATKLPD